MVRKFYTDASRLTRAEAGPHGTVFCGRSQVVRGSSFFLVNLCSEIHNIVLSMAYEGCKAEIVTVDSSESIGGSVFVLVTGILHKHRSNRRRKFVQTFLLAPQERGYYVLIDIFRYLDKERQCAVYVEKVPNGSLDMFDGLQISSAETEARVPEVPLEEYAAHSHKDTTNADQAGGEERCSDHMSEISLNETVAQNEQLTELEASRSCDEGSGADKKSYASILRLSMDGSTVGAQSVTSVVSHQQMNDQSNSSYQYSNTSPLAESSAFARAPKAQVKSVYVKNLPINVTKSQVGGEFVKIGCSRPLNVILKSHKDGGVYAFVDFKDLPSVTIAIEASPIIVGGRRVYIEERKSTYTGSAHGQGRGSGRGASSGV
ncbi:hypothetical protein KP509_25G013600 [Ceratopteris richardii]|nr:hypothetical protein KP509_25G013600 [Ceratopteris richardii]